MIKFFEKFPGVTAIVSEKIDGNMKINHENGESTNDNRNRFFERLGIPKNRVHSALLDHTDKISEVIGSSDRFIAKVDSLIAKDKGAFLSITVADCIPVLFHDPEEKIVAITHAGWSGVVSGIVPRTACKIIELGSKPENIYVEIGPGVCQKCFEFDLDQAEKEFKNFWNKEFVDFNIQKEKVYIDLKKIIQSQLRCIGLNDNNINVSTECTCCNDKFFSHRREKKDPIDAMIVLIGMKHS